MAMTQLTNLSKEQFLAIGYIAVNWTDLEVMFMYALWGVCKLNVKQGRVLTTHMSHLNRIDAIKTILNTEYSGKSIETEMLKFIEKSEKLRNKRNLIIHGQWSLAGNNKSRVVSHTARAKLGLKDETYTLEQMIDLSNNIITIQKELSQHLRDNKLFPDFSSGLSG